VGPEISDHDTTGEADLLEVVGAGRQDQRNVPSAEERLRLPSRSDLAPCDRGTLPLSLLVGNVAKSTGGKGQRDLERGSSEPLAFAFAGYDPPVPAARIERFRLDPLADPLSS